MKQVILSLFGGIILFRLIALILGLFYGPYIYIVLPFGGLYLTLDCCTAYFIYASDDDTTLTSNERVFSWAWIISNVFALLGLIASIVLFLVNLGFWSMSYQPIHLAQFVFIVCLSLFIGLNIMLLFKNLKSKRKPQASYEGLAVVY